VSSPRVARSQVTDGPNSEVVCAACDGAGGTTAVVFPASTQSNQPRPCQSSQLPSKSESMAGSLKLLADWSQDHKWADGLSVPATGGGREAVAKVGKADDGEVAVAIWPNPCESGCEASESCKERSQQLVHQGHATIVTYHISWVRQIVVLLLYRRFSPEQDIHCCMSSRSSSRVEKSSLI
jgi:hypothetical protein